MASGTTHGPFTAELMGVGPVKGLGSSGSVTKARYANMKFGDSKNYMIWPFEEEKNNISLKQAKMVGQRARNGLNQPKTLDSINI